MDFQISDERAVYHARVDHYVIDHYGEKIGAYGIAVYTVLSRFANFNTKQGFPSLQTIAKKLKMSPRKVADVIKELETQGLIKITSGKESGKPNTYTLVNLFEGFAPDAKGGMHTVHTPMHEVQTGMQDVHTGYAYSAYKRERTKEKKEKETITTTPVPVFDTEKAMAYKVLEDTLGSLTPFVSEKAGAALEDYGCEWFVAACQEAQTANVRKWNYINGILKNWKEKGRGIKGGGTYPTPAPATIVTDEHFKIVESYKQRKAGVTL